MSIIKNNVSREMLSILQDKRGRNVLIYNRNFDTFDGYFFDGSFVSGISVCILDIIVMRIQ